MTRFGLWLLERRTLKDDRARCSYGMTYLRERQMRSDLIPDMRVYDRTRRGFTKAGGR